MPRADIRIGTAGWTIARDMGESFPGSGSHLERYSRHFNCAEINATFYRQPRVSTLLRWAASTPDHFRFSLKMPRAITHEGALQADRDKLIAFLKNARVLGHKLGPILIQLPPKRIYEPLAAQAFFTLLHDLHPQGSLVLEPRHPSWFIPEAQSVLDAYSVCRVIADPTPAAAPAVPASERLTYRRLHGSPRVYYSSYSAESLNELKSSITAASSSSEHWVIFDNTASGAAIHNAFDLQAMLQHP